MPPLVVVMRNSGGGPKVRIGREPGTVSELLAGILINAKHPPSLTTPPPQADKVVANRISEDGVSCSAWLCFNYDVNGRLRL